MVHFGNFMLDFTFFPLWTLAVCLSTAVWTPIEGQPRVIGSLQPIIAAPGDDVILPCHLDPAYNVEDLTVEWSKPDLKPDPSDRLSRVDYVHVYRDGRENLDMKLQSYFGRTMLFTDQLKRGNISLKITNVTPADGGRYKCFIPKLNSQVKESIILLSVDPNFVKSSTTETPLLPTNVQTPDPKEETDVKGGRSYQGVWIPAVVFGVLLVLGVCGGVAGYVIKHKPQKLNLPKYEVTPERLLPV
ncbi:myelin-oligodendrocyte glycoprotein-like [Micropterus dolomieu]|uniref:myelin-oligodendrocyte glycoprotein-like n=1 Tax=Micropterus dolomieu TaxID=147949 RepID=UPI001E8CFE9E|nr:myelin-oligodendrocyte glycoprotein-like [Micropterus dolomieu]